MNCVIYCVIRFFLFGSQFSLSLSLSLKLN